MVRYQLRSSVNQTRSLTPRVPVQIVRCETLPCALHADNECLWTDWVLENYISGPQAQHFACIKRRDGSCAWYRGAAQPKKDFLDIEEP
jgi:hypothetical protein